MDQAIRNRSEAKMAGGKSPHVFQSCSYLKIRELRGLNPSFQVKKGNTRDGMNIG